MPRQSNAIRHTNEHLTPQEVCPPFLSRVCTKYIESPAILQLNPTCHYINVDYIEIRLIEQIICRCWVKQPFEPSARLGLDVWPRMGAKIREIPGQVGVLIRTQRRMANARIRRHNAVLQVSHCKCSTEVTANKELGCRRRTRAQRAKLGLTH